MMTGERIATVMVELKRLEECVAKVGSRVECGDAGDGVRLYETFCAPDGRPIRAISQRLRARNKRVSERCGPVPPEGLLDG